MAGLLIGATAHIVWFTQHSAEPTETVRVVTVPAPEAAVTLHVHHEGPATNLTVDKADPSPSACRHGFDKSRARRARRANTVARPKLKRAASPQGAIVCTAERCTLRRDFIDRVRDNPTRLAQQARFVPSQHDGKFNGIKVYGIRRGSIPALVGLANGDLITEIDGQPLTSISDVFDIALAPLSSDRFTVTFDREDQTLTREFVIED